MNIRVVGIYREAEFSPGKESADRLIMDAVLDNLRSIGAQTSTIEVPSFISLPLPSVHLALAMCQSGPAIDHLAALEQAGAVVINSALAIRNCYRDLLGPGLSSAGVPSPEGVVVRTATAIDERVLGKLDLSNPIYVKRGDLHALGPQDVQRTEDMAELETVLMEFAGRGIEVVYLQQESVGQMVKFYGIGNGSDYFSLLPMEGKAGVNESVRRSLARAGGIAASALGLQVWGGDAVIGNGNFSIIDFNDWPSFEAVREAAAIAIARHSLVCLRRHPAARGLSL